MSNSKHIDEAFIRKHFTDTTPFIDIVTPELTKKERRKIYKNDPKFTNPTNSAMTLLHDRLIKNVHPHNYSLYILDENSDTLLIKTSTGWEEVLYEVVVNSVNHLILPLYHVKLIEAALGINSSKLPAWLH